MNKISSRELRVVAIVLGFLASFMILFPALSAGNGDSTYTGLQVTFGHEFINLGGFGSGQIAFSILNLIAFTLPLVGALLLLFTFNGHVTSIFLFGAATVLLFLVPEFTVVSVTVLGNTNQIDIDWTYSVGLIFAISFSMIGLLIGLFRVIKKV